MIPFLDLEIQHRQLEEELIEVFREALENAAFVGGAQVEAFEEEFARFCEVRYCVGVNSGTDALRFALLASGVGPGDEVITVPNTFIATVEAISQTGAMPSFVDVDERTYNMDAEKLREFLEKKCRYMRTTGSPVDKSTGRTVKAVIPVHLYGQPADMDSILEIAARYNLIVIDDACQAHGAEYLSRTQNRWKKVGSMGRAAAFSFYPGKNLGACGEGGAVITNSKEIVTKTRMLRDHGQRKKYFHQIEGFNGRLDAIQAGTLRVKLRHLGFWNEKRRENASRYRHLLENLKGIILPYEPPWSKAVYHLYVIRAPRRDELQKYLADRGIVTALHYPVPIHLQVACRRLGYKRGDFPITEKITSEIVSLPMFPELTFDQQDMVANAIKAFLSSQ